MDLSELRVEIDGIDEKIVFLYEKRMAIAKSVAEYKIENGKQVFDKVREAEKLARVKTLASNEFNRRGVEELFEQIMAMSRKLQYSLLAEQQVQKKNEFIQLAELERKNAKVVFQGADGAYSKVAMEEYFGKVVDSVHVDTFRDAMQTIAGEKADFAVLPIENSSAGVVSEIYDLLVEFDNCIVGEQIIKIEHCLLGMETTNLDEITTVLSHPQSLMQSSIFLNKYPQWKQISMQNNAFAVRKVAEEADNRQVAIAGEHAGSIYGLCVLEKGINDNKSNSTRFIIVAKKKVFLENAQKISVCFELPHTSGSLYRILSHFIYNNLNMNKIESRPIAGKNWEYRFFIDFDGNLNDSAVKNALFALEEETSNLKILGNY